MKKASVIMSIDLKSNSLESGRKFAILNLGASKKQSVLQTTPFKVRCHIVFLILFMSLIICSSLISAIDLDIKSSFYPGETLQVEIPNVFIDNLKLENIGIYQNNSVHVTPIEPGLVKSGDSYFYYAILPSYPGLYSFKIENVKYWEGSDQVTTTIVRNFSIEKTNASYLSFSPGYLSVTNDFSVLVTGYNKRQEITVSFEPTNFEQKFNLSYHDTKRIYFSIEGITNFTKSEIRINDYILPAIISPSGNANNNFNLSGTDQLEIMDSLEDVMDFYPEEIAATILPGKDYYYELKLTNDIDASIEDLTISASDKEIKLDPTTISELNAQKSSVVKVILNSNVEKDAWINVTYKNYSVLIPVLIKIATNQSDVDSNVETVNQQKTCTELGGAKCDSTQNQKCSGSETYAFDGWCCMTKCTSSSSASGWLWGVLIVVVLAIGGWFLYDKSQKGQGSEKLKELFQKRNDAYENRIRPQPPREVRGGLSKS